MNYNSFKTKKRIKTFSSDQRIRSVTNKSASHYTIDFEENVTNVTGLKVLNCYIPRSEYIIDNHNDCIDYEKLMFLSSNSYISKGVFTIHIPHGNYTINELLDELREYNQF